MIIDARDDVITLSGNLDKNQWPAIQAAAHLLLRQNTYGILIDASQIATCTPEGARTFLNALEYIERHRARIVLCRVPESVMAVIRTVPGVRSKVPIAPTLTDARASLDIVFHNPERDGRRRGRDGSVPAVNILVPVLPGLPTVREALGLAQTLGTMADEREGADRRTAPIPPRIHVAYMLVVPRSIPLNAPLGEEEDEARILLADANLLGAEHGLDVHADVARTREVSEEIVTQASKLESNKIVLVLPPSSAENSDYLKSIVTTLLAKAPCEVVVRKSPG